MKLLLDENLSDQVIYRIVDLYPNSQHVKTLGLINTDDAIIWKYAKTNGFIIVSKDSDFHQHSIKSRISSIAVPKEEDALISITPGILRFLLMRS